MTRDAHPPSAFSSSHLGDPVEPGALLAGRYRLTGILGRGGMAVVFDAVDERLGRRVALKAVGSPAVAETVANEQCLAEARHLASVDSPSIVRVLDVGVDSPDGRDVPYLVLERLDGEDLWTYVRRRSLGYRDVVRIGLELCEAVSALHAAGIVHNDIKPENVFLCDGPDGRASLKLIDLGIASRIGEPDPPGAPRRAGSPGYIAPERIDASDGGASEPRSDIWSLGVVLYELLALRSPFPGETPVELCCQVLAADVPRVGTFCPGLPTGLEAVVEKAMQRVPSARFGDVGELAAALSEYAGSEGAELASRAQRRLERQSLAPFPLLRLSPPSPLFPAREAASA